MGDFAQQSLPLDDQVVLTIKREGAILPETILVSYALHEHRRHRWLTWRLLDSLPIAFCWCSLHRLRVLPSE